MNHLLNGMMGEAKRLTQIGNLQAATELIQRTLRGAGGPANHPTTPEPARPREGIVIDVESRLVDEIEDPVSRPQSMPSPQAHDSTNDRWMRATFTHKGRDLVYRLFVPNAGSCTGPRPLVLMLHGCTQNADDFAAGTDMNALARDAGVLVLYPEQTQHANAQRCWNWFKVQHQQRGRGEPELLACLTRQVIAEYDVDTSRVYVAGLSAGGAMADIMGRAYPDLFTAVGVHSGLPAGAAADLPSALAAMRSGTSGAAAGPGAVLPIIVFHGDADPTVNCANGAAVVTSARSSQQIEGMAHTTHGQTPNRQRYTRTSYTAADGSTVIEYWQLHGARHAWSGGSAAGSYTAPGGVGASKEMLRFFLSHERQMPH